jgi:DNA repair protein RecO (recombination protein O)
VDIFAQEHGRLRAVARGVRGGKPQELQPFVALEVAWSGSGTLKTLTQVEVSTPTSPLLRGRALYLGLYVNELLVRLLPEYDPHPALYARYRQLLRDLAGPGDAEPLLRRFELALLADLGYGLALDRDGHAGLRIDPDVDYVYVAGTGLVPRDTVGGDDARHRLPGRHLLAIAAEDYTGADVRQCAKELLRTALADHLGGRPLRSRELFRKLVNNGVGTG